LKNYSIRKRLLNQILTFPLSGAVSYCLIKAYPNLPSQIHHHLCKDSQNQNLPFQFISVLSFHQICLDPFYSLHGFKKDLLLRFQLILFRYLLFQHIY